jgi:polyhydroxybutyrate depolymerase
MPNRSWGRIAGRLWAMLVIAGGLSGFSVPAAAQPEESGSLMHQGLRREWLLLRPAGDGPRPLVLALHGLGQSTENLRRGWTLDAVAAREGFAVAYPRATGERWSYSAQRPVTLPDGAGLVDDVGFLAALLGRVAAEGVADPARIFVAGVSNGGLMAFSLACMLSDSIVAVAPMITGMTDGQMADCRPARPVPIMVVAGTNDPVQAYDGWIFPGFRLISVPETLEFWRRLHGCTGQQARLLPHRDPTDTTRVLRIDWTGCPRPTALRLFRVQGGGHQLPSQAATEGLPPRFGSRARDVETAEEVWAFFAAQPRLSSPPPSGRSAP